MHEKTVMVEEKLAERVIGDGNKKSSEIHMAAPPP